LRISFNGCSLVAPSLHEQVENLAFVVDRAPEPEPPACNHHGHLVEMPPRRGVRMSTAKFSGVVAQFGPYAPFPPEK
jgi:hypothetical protein